MRSPSRTIPVTFCLLLAAAHFARAATYYVSPDGDDTSTGTSPQLPWKTLRGISTASLAPGDQILLRRGAVWHESFYPSVSGDAAHPILIAAYGQGDRPVIDAADPIPPSAFEGTNISGIHRARLDQIPDIVWSGLGPPLDEAHSPNELTTMQNGFYVDGRWLYVHANIQNQIEIPDRELCIDIGQSHIALRSIAICHAARPDRGAITVWADHDLDGIDIQDCDISNNAGRGLWLCGPPSRSIRDVIITHNQFRGNCGSGLLMVLADQAQVRDNQFTGNCRDPIEPWQAGIRVWSAGIQNLLIEDNTIRDQRWHHPDDSSMGIHCDETGPNVVIRGNTISHLDHAGIEIENTRGVVAEQNLISDCNNGIFLDRAGHDHFIRRNWILDSRSHALLLLGWRALGVNAGAEITVNGRLLTRNLIEDNLCLGSRLAELRAGDGGELVDPPLGNIYRVNDFGPERPGFIQWGSKLLDHYSQWPVPGGAAHNP